MSLHVDDNGKVQDGDEPNPVGAGHRLGVGDVRHVADEALERAKAALPDPSLKFELPKFEIPTGVYVAFGVGAAAFVGVPLLGIYLAGRAAAKAAPIVAQAGPALLPFVPEAAPVVAGAKVLTALQSQSAPPPDAVASLVAAARGTVQAASAAPVSGAPTGASRFDLPRELWAWGGYVPSNPGLLSTGAPSTSGPPVQVVPPPAPAPAPRAAAPVVADILARTLAAAK